VTSQEDLGVNPEAGLSSVCSSTLTTQCTDRYSDTVIKFMAMIVGRYCSFLPAFSVMRLKHIAGAFPHLSNGIISNHHRVIQISIYTSTEQAAPQVTYFFVTVDIKLPESNQLNSQD